MLLLTHRQAFTLLAALRYWQQRPDAVVDVLNDLATNDGEVAALSTNEVDDLCADINPSAHGPETFQVAWCIDLESESPVAAAKRALEIHRDPESIATAFIVRSSNGQVTKVDFEELSAEPDSEEEAPPPEKITAELVIDASNKKHEFDCTDWLRQIDVETLEGAAEQAFGSSEYTDSIPYFYETSNELIAAIITYTNIADLPFDVTIEPQPVLSWLKANRPDAYPSVLAAYKTVQF